MTRPHVNVDRVEPPRCVECGCAQPEGARGWRAYLTTDEDEPAEAAVYCRSAPSASSGQPARRGQLGGRVSDVGPWLFVVSWGNWAASTAVSVLGPEIAVGLFVDELVEQTLAARSAAAIFG